MDLFTPFAKLGLKNRTVMAPMTRYHCTPDGAPTPALVEYYNRRAANNLGLIIVESSAINANDAKGYVNGAAFHNEQHVEAWKPLVRKVQAQGAKIWIQLFHAGRLTVKEITGTKVVAPSAVEQYPGESFWRPKKEDQIVHFQTGTPYLTPTELSVDEIKRVIAQFADACRLAEKAGFDGVELHGAHGYLIHQFCQRLTNHRSDAYNAKDFRFVKELVQACRAAVSDRFTLAYRISLHMVDNSYLRYEKEEMDYEKLVKILDKEGIDVFHSSEINAGSKMFGGDVPLHQFIRANTAKPIIACGRINKLKKANKLLTEGHVDLIAIGRSLVSNPELVTYFEKEQDFEFVKFDYSQHIDKIV